MLSARPVGLPLNVDMSTKTPGRMLAKTRNVLQENTVRNAPMTVIGKGRKVVQNTPLQSKALQADRVLKDLPGKQVGPSKLKDTPAVRPLGDKTPFPNRIASQSSATGAKIAKPALGDGSLHPSSVRKHDRLPRSAGKAFETPVTNGKHWDVSDIEIEVDAPIANQSIEEESCDEIEYMPPKVEDIPYEPPFEMPNYREVGKTLMALIRTYTLEDDPPTTNVTFTADASESNFFTPPTLPQQEIEDDSPFARAKPAPETKPQPLTVPKHKSTLVNKPTARPAAQRTTPATRTVAPLNPRAPPPPVRRSSTTSAARPTATAVRTSSSQPVTRAPTSRATTRTPSVARSTPLVHTGTTQLTRTTSLSRPTPPVRTGATQLTRTTSLPRPTTKPATRPTVSTAPAMTKAVVAQPSVVTSTARHPVPFANASPNTGRPRSGTITKAEFESNTHVAIHIRNSSLEDVKKDLEGLIVLEDAFDDDDEFRFDV